MKRFSMKRAFVFIAIVLAACGGDVVGDSVKLGDAEARLRKDPHDSQSLDFILRKLNDVSKITRNSAAAILRVLAAADPNVRSAIAPKSIPALIEVAQRQDDNEQQGISALGEFRELGAPAVPTLIKRLSDPSFPNVDYATEALGKIGPASIPAVPILRRQLRNTDPNAYEFQLWVTIQLRVQSAVAIRRIVPDDRESLDYLIELLSSSDPRFRLQAIMALQDLGKLALPAVPALESYREDENARNAAWTIKEEAGVPR